MHPERVRCTSRRLILALAAVLLAFAVFTRVFYVIFGN